MDEKEREELYQTTGLAQQAGDQAHKAAATEFFLEEQYKSLAEAQLEVETTMKNLYHRLRQDIYKPDEKNEKMSWHPIGDAKKRKLTDDGVEKIMEIISWYVNKENLLSNFDEDQINNIMKDFRLAVTANILMRYKIYFREPSIEECKEILDKRLKEHMKIKGYSYEVLDKEIDEKKIKEEVLSEVGQRIEYEIKKIRETKLKENLSEFELLFISLSQLVLATLNRAYRGEERGSLRRHQSIQEIIGGKPQMPKGEHKNSFFGR